MYGEVIAALPVTKGPPPLVTIAPHRKSATNVGGTMMPLTKNKMRSFLIGMQAKTVWNIQ